MARISHTGLYSHREAVEGRAWRRGWAERCQNGQGDGRREAQQPGMQVWSATGSCLRVQIIGQNWRSSPVMPGVSIIVKNGRCTSRGLASNDTKPFWKCTYTYRDIQLVIKSPSSSLWHTCTYLLTVTPPYSFASPSRMLSRIFCCLFLLPCSMRATILFAAFIFLHSRILLAFSSVICGIHESSIDFVTGVGVVDGNCASTESYSLCISSFDRSVLFASSSISVCLIEPARKQVGK